jgi:hypothetical protein
MTLLRILRGVSVTTADEHEQLKRLELLPFERDRIVGAVGRRN